MVTAGKHGNLSAHIAAGIASALVTLAALQSATAQVVSETLVIQTTNNVFDLNPERDALSARAGRIRIKHTVTDGVDPIDLDGGYPIPMTVSDRLDGYTVATINSVSGAPPNEVWWIIQAIGAGSYDLSATVTLPDDTFQVFHRYLTVTNIPTGAAVINIDSNAVTAQVSITNVVSSALNIYYWGTNVASVTNGP